VLPEQKVILDWAGGGFTFAAAKSEQQLNS
jgi:hypothetical protein